MRASAPRFSTIATAISIGTADSSVEAALGFVAGTG
jgi:hypothetical protein